MREHWRDPGYWRWLWHRNVPLAAKIGSVVLLLALLLGGGWFAADRMTAAHAKVASTGPFVLETTVQQLVTVRERGKVVRKLIPVVKKVVSPQTVIDARTSYLTQVVKTPGTVRVVRRVITTKVPVVTKQVVTVHGKTRTIVTTRLVPTTRVQTQTQTQIQTQTRVQTNQQTVTNTTPSPTVTQVRTNTVTQTQTLPPVTVTHTETQTQTQTVTNTVTETVTETVNDTQTVTVTVTVTQTGP